MSRILELSTKNPYTTAHLDDVLATANRYAEICWTVVSAHVPIFSASGRVGCSCESYKRSDAYRKYLEDNGLGAQFDKEFTCPSPGKHPRGSWRDGVGVSPTDFHKTWGRFYTVIDVDTGKPVRIVWNIGVLTGPSDLLTLDADTYKETYECDLTDLIPLSEQETPTAISQSGGTHLIYDRNGENYSNASGRLPEGIDIRGVGGFLALAPSIGPSGNHYAWTEGYEPWEIDQIRIPASLRNLLGTTSGKANRTFTAAEIDTEAVKRSSERVEQILGIIGGEFVGPSAWSGDGVLYRLSECPFQPKDNPHANNDGPYIAILPDGAVSASCHHNRCQHTIEASGGSGWAYLQAQAISTDEEFGLLWQAAPTPSVKAMKPAIPGNRNINTTRRLYESLSAYAASWLGESGRASAFLDRNGISMDVAQAAGVGYMGKELYQAWFSTLTDTMRAGLKDAGLPNGDGDRLTSFGSKLVGGLRGKLLFPYRSQFGEVCDFRTVTISDSGAELMASPSGNRAERGAMLPFGIDSIQSGAMVIITVGEMRRLRLLTDKATRKVIAIRSHTDWCSEYTAMMANKTVVLAFGATVNGKMTPENAATIEISRLLRVHQVSVLVAVEGIAHYLTQPEFESMLKAAGVDVSEFTQPRADRGTDLRWVAEEAVNARPHADISSITVEEAVALMKAETKNHLTNYKRGGQQLLVVGPAGTGKTTTVIKTVHEAIGKDATVAVILPNHSTVDEKIAEGVLKREKGDGPEAYRHIYGFNKDNCDKSEDAIALVKKDYSPGVILCPNCIFKKKCEESGYRSQFNKREDRAYVHAHTHTILPRNEDVVIIDELTHKQFIRSITIWLSDIEESAKCPSLSFPQRKLMEALGEMFANVHLTELEGVEFYSVLSRYFDSLYNVGVWGDEIALQAKMDLFVSESVKTGNYEKLPRNFGEKLISVMADDVRRLISGEQVSGRLYFVTTKSGDKFIELTVSKGNLPAWYLDRPVFILNATADADLMEELCGPLKVVAPNVKIAEGNTIIQDVTRNNAKSSLAGGSQRAQWRRGEWSSEIRKHIDAHPGGEVDTTIICSLVVEEYLKRLFPLAKVAHYGALEGRNDLQNGLTILANPPSVNWGAIRKEAAALRPGVDTSLARKVAAFEEENAANELLGIEQFDGADPFVARLVFQHRDAMAIQAVHRSRIIRATGRTVVVMFSRPIPGLAPNEIVSERQGKPSANPSLQKLVDAARELVSEKGGFAVSALIKKSGISKPTTYKHLDSVVSALGLSTIDLPVFHMLVNGGKKSEKLTAVMCKESYNALRLHGVKGTYKEYLITGVNSMHCSNLTIQKLESLIPETWQIDYELLPAALGIEVDEQPPIQPDVDVDELEANTWGYDEEEYFFFDGQALLDYVLAGYEDF